MNKKSYLCKKIWSIMEAIQLREELFREMNPMLDSEDMLRKMLDFVRSLFIEQKNAEKKQALDKIDHAFNQLHQMQGGELKGITAEDLLNEL